MKTNNTSQFLVSIQNSTLSNLATAKKCLLTLEKNKEAIVFYEMNTEQKKNKLIELDALSIIFIGKETRGLLRRKVLILNTVEKPVNNTLTEDIEEDIVEEIVLKPIQDNITVEELDKAIICFIKDIEEIRKKRKEFIPYNILDLQQFQKTLSNVFSLSEKIIDFGLTSFKTIADTSMRTIDSGIKKLNTNIRAIMEPGKKVEEKPVDTAIDVTEEQVFEDRIEEFGPERKYKNTFLFIPPPGTTGNLIFESFIDKLSRKNRCINYLLPGMGKRPFQTNISEETILSDLTQLISDKKDKKPLIVISFSVGGIFALKLLEKHPEEIHGLILVSYPGYLDENIQNLMAMVPPPFFWPPLKGRAIQAFRNIAFDHKSDPKQIQILQYFNKIQNSTLHQYLKIYSKTTQPDINSIKTPILIILGTKDQIFAQTNIRSLVENNKNITLKWIEGKHMLIVENPKEIQQIITTWRKQSV